jgi:hypothetical protein
VAQPPPRWIATLSLYIYIYMYREQKTSYFLSSMLPQKNDQTRNSLPESPSAKALPSVALGKEGSAYSASAKPSVPSTFSRALGKVVCRVPESTRQRKAVVTATGDGDGVFTECPRRHSAKELSLSSVSLTALGKESVRGGPHVRYFASVKYLTLDKEASLPSVNPRPSAKADGRQL